MQEMKEKELKYLNLEKRLAKERVWEEWPWRRGGA